MEAAIRRMAHYGIQKTTLSEVAEDVALSKQALAYYYPDKATLVRAVVARIGTDYLQALRDAVAQTGEFAAALEQLVLLRARFHEQYFALFSDIEKEGGFRREEAAGMIREAAAAEVAVLEGSYAEGVRRGSLRAAGRNTVRLIVDILTALGRGIWRDCLPDAETFRETVRRQKETITLICQGIEAGHA
ncbi:MAG: TetR/AcrR family transcriptional regulator [Chitinophagaceae bacterium]|nr:MAG: TetR/AcrR family transcriptional regulator [Chitinophagaceae bacterium]